MTIYALSEAKREMFIKETLEAVRRYLVANGEIPDPYSRKDKSDGKEHPRTEEAI